MKSFHLMVLLLACLAGICACSTPASQSSVNVSEPEKTDVAQAGTGASGEADLDKSIRKIDFQNFTYEPHCAGEASEKVTVKNGEFSKETKQDDYIDRFYFKVYEVSYGDVDADNKEDAIILTNCNAGGTGQFSEGFVYTLRSGKPTLMDRIEGGDRAYGGLRATRVENGILVVESNGEGEEGGACCPEFLVTTKYKWDGKKLAQQGAVTKKPLYPEEKVAFAKGTSKSVIKVTVDDIKRYTLGARAGQTMTVTVNSEMVTASLIKGDADVTEGANSFTARLKENGNYVIQIQNINDKPTPVTLTIEIR